MNECKVFVGNLPFSVRSSDLEELFHPFGDIIGVNIREDRATGRPRGFAFVTFSSESSAQESIHSLNGSEYNGRVLTVSLATLRGSENQKSLDESWKTAPPTRSGSDKKQNNQTKNQKKSWTTWASLPQSSLSSSTSPSNSTTTQSTQKISSKKKANNSDNSGNSENNVEK